MKNRMMLLALLLLCASCIHAELAGRPLEPASAILSQTDVLFGVLGPLILVMVVLAAAVYMIGQMFDSETRARASVWSQGMLMAAGVATLMVVLLYFIVPGIIRGETPFFNAITIIGGLAGLASTALATLIVLLLVLAAAAYGMGQVSGAETRSRANVWTQGMISGAIVAAAIYVLVFSILPPLGERLFASGPLYNYRLVIISVTFFVTAFILITYLLSKTFKVPEWEAYLNIELSNLMTSFLVAIFVIGLFSVGDVVAAAYSPPECGAVTSPPTAAICYMRDHVADSVLRGLFDVYQIQACTSILSTFSRRIGEYVLTQTFKVFPGMDTFVSITNVLGMGLVTIYGSVSAQIAFMYFIDGTVTNFFLPAGLILRFFPPTRDSGAFLIALAFGFQVIFPVTYQINAGIYEELGGTDYQSPSALIWSLCGPFKYGVWGFLLNPAANPIFKLPGGMVIGTALSRIVSESFLNAVSMSEFIPIMQNLAKLSLFAIFLPTLSMTITIAFINAMTKFLVGKG